jgi:signal transduction histidine kinase
MEASQPGDIIRLGCRELHGRVEFWVQNPAVIPEPVRLQIFQRSFSTKGPGRGLGAYSVKLLGERYLGGQVDFTTSPEEGTIFRISLPVE